MPKINLSHSSKLSPEEAFEKVCCIIEEDKQLKSLDSGYQCDFNKKKLCGSAKSKFFKADLSVTESKSGSDIEIIIDLPMKFALAKGMITKTLQNKMKSVL